MRRKFNEITDRVRITALLQDSTIGRLASLGKDGYPYITPLNYVYHKESIYFHCARSGEKLDNIQADPRVCFEVDIPLAYLDSSFDPEAPPCEVGQLFQSVVIRGRAEIVGDREEKLEALNALMASHEGQADYSAITADMPGFAACCVVAVRPERFSAKENLLQRQSEPQKDKVRAYLKKRGLPGDEEAAELL